MHARFYNEAVLELSLRPRVPFLIKSGETGRGDLDPTLPDMFFVRTRRPGASEDTLYIPGSSFRGMLRSHSERLVRSLDLSKACDPTRSRDTKQERILPAGEDIRVACPADLQEMSKRPKLIEVWEKSCYTCRLFGNTGLAGRVRTSDWYPNVTPLTEVRYGVAIDRVTNAVAQGPFQAEIVTDGVFEGEISLRNFTLGQLGLVGAALLDLDDGLVALGYAKSRGLGRVKLTFPKLTLRFPRDPAGYLQGLGSLVDETRRKAYDLPQDDLLPMEVPATQVRWFHQVQLAGEAVQPLLEALSPRWVNEVGSGGA